MQIDKVMALDVSK